MKWEEALKLIVANIKVGIKLDDNFKYKNVEQTPPYKCFKFDYNGEEGFLIKVSKVQSIEIPLSMLKNLYLSAQANDNCYDRSIFISKYPHQTIQQIGHIHIVGKMFVHAGVAVQESNWKYTIL